MVDIVRLSLVAGLVGAIALGGSLYGGRVDATGPDTGLRNSPSPPTATDTSLLNARDAVWRAWFDHDRAALQRLVPPDVVAINAGDSTWYDWAGVLEASRDFRAGGGRLVDLTFPRVHIQRFGDVAIIYSQYEMTTALEQDTSTLSGRATEVFVRQPSGWINPGWHLDSGQ